MDRCNEPNSKPGMICSDYLYEYIYTDQLKKLREQAANHIQKYEDLYILNLLESIFCPKCNKYHGDLITCDEYIIKEIIE